MATTQLDPVTDLERAEAELDLLRKRIGSRDAKVTVHDLHHAETAVRFARMRIEAAAEAEAQAREQARLDRVAAIRASLPAIVDTTKLDAAHQEIVKALDAYCEEAERIERGFVEVYDELIRMPPSGISIDVSAYAPTIGGYRKLTFSHQVTEAVTDAFRRHGLRIEEGGR